MTINYIIELQSLSTVTVPLWINKTGFQFYITVKIPQSRNTIMTGLHPKTVTITKKKPTKLQLIYELQYCELSMARWPIVDKKITNRDTVTVIVQPVDTVLIKFYSICIKNLPKTVEKVGVTGEMVHKHNHFI